jgi:predicted HTH domain antitoxin
MHAMSGPTRRVTVRVELPWAQDDVPDPTALGDELRRLWLVEQVRHRKIGVGKGAELAGMPRAAFMRLLGEHGVPVIDYSVEDLQREIETLAHQ